MSDTGALEKPYTLTGRTWWLSNSLDTTDPAGAMAPIVAFQDELQQAGPRSVATYARFTLHLSAADVEEVDRRILDDYVATDHQRRQHPAHGGIFVLHRLDHDRATDPVPGRLTLTEVRVSGSGGSAGLSG